MNMNEALSTPTKCGCAGGIVASCGMDDSAGGKPRSKDHGKHRPSIPPCKRPSSLLEEQGGETAESGSNGTRGTKHSESGKTQYGTEKRWYATVLRGAFGRWGTRGKGRNLTHKWDVNQECDLPSSNPSITYNTSSNNNCDKSGGSVETGSQCKCGSKTPPNKRRIALEKGSKSDPDLTGRKLKNQSFFEATEYGKVTSESHNHHLSSNLGGDRSRLTAPAGASSVEVRGSWRSNTTEQRPKSDSGSRLKLPSLPYRDSEFQYKSVAKSKEKWQRTKRRFLSSPIHRKENQDRKKVPSTYVSFQEDFAEDVYLNVEAQKGVISASVTPVAERSGSSSDSPLEVSPSSLADDVFAESYAEHLDNCPRTIHFEGDDTAVNQEQVDNERIAELFQKVTNAFEKRKDQKTEKMTPVCDKQKIACASGHEDLNPSQFTSSSKSATIQMEHIDTIMASANLHASLDNALSMLSESTKLLTPSESRSLGIGSYHSRYHSGIGVFQSRTYSTCSKLEPIAEENDKTEKATRRGAHLANTVDPDLGNSSQDAKFNFGNLRTTAFLHQGISDSQFCNTSKQSRSSHLAHKSGTCIDSANERQASACNPKLQWLIDTTSGTARSTGISTISVGSVRRSTSTSQDTTRQPSSVKTCVACEWAHRGCMPPYVSVIPYDEWRWIVNDCNTCHNHSHFHPWGACSEQGRMPALCHSHYLQYYQHLQNSQATRGTWHSNLLPQADSLTDYETREAMSNLDEIMTGGNNNNSGMNNGSSEMRLRFMDLKLGKGPYKQSDTDLSVNSDSAFSTNGSPTSSTRDGMNTDRESIGSMSEKFEMEEEVGKLRGFSNECWTSNDEGLDAFCAPSQRHQESIHAHSPRGKRTQSYDDAKSRIPGIKCVTNHHENRYSLVSSLCSYASPLASDNLCDSAVHLQDSASSHSTHFSSDSFYSSGTSFGDKETFLTDGTNESVVLSRSSSEESLQSEGTLCLSEFAMSQQNISLCSAQSFPEISDLCSPTRQVNLKPHQAQTSIGEQFETWLKNASTSEGVLESFLNSSLAHMQKRNKVPPIDKSCLSNSTIQNTDTLTSSSGSSDTNTLGSGSSGSTYASSSLRSYSRLNTFDSSSCVSTDDTGETVIDQYILRSKRRLQNIQETETNPKYQRMRRKRSSDARVRYQPSAFHYENLEAPSFSSKVNTVHHQLHQITNISFSGEKPNMVVTEGMTKTTHYMRTRSSSMSCIRTTVTKKTSCIERQSKSLPCIYLSNSVDKGPVKIVGQEEHTSQDEVSMKPIPPVYGRVLQSKVHSMMQSCTDIDNVIESLRNSLKEARSKETESILDNKLQELSAILKQKDEMIKELHQILLSCSTPPRSIGYKHQFSATM